MSEASYFYTNMVSAAAFVELINPDQFTIDRDEFLAHMAAAGVPLETLQPPVASVPVASSPGNPAVPSQPQAGWVAGSLPPSFSSLSRHQAGGSAVSLLPGLPPLVTKRTVAELEAEGVGLLVDAEGRGELRGAHRFLYASAGDLTVSDVEALLVSYKELVLRYEALARAVNRQEDIDVASVLQISVPPAFAPQHRQPDGEDAGIQVSTISDDGPPPCAGPEHEESVEVVGDAQEVRRSVAEAPRQQQAQEEAYAEGEANLSAVAEDVAPQEVNALVEMINGKEVAQADAALAETSAPQQERFNVLESELSNVAVDSGPPEDYVEVVQEVEDEAENAVASREPSALQEETAEHRQKSPTEQDEAPGTPRVNEPQGVLFEGGEADPSGSGDQGTPAEPAGAKGSERADAAVSELSSSLEMAPALQEVLLLGMERAQLPLPGALEGTAAPMAEDPTSTDLLSFPGDLPEGMMANIDADKSGDSGATPASEVQATASLI